MGNESTELTFVRCPSCRSLVPASATRCRICNNPLDGAAKLEDSDPTKGASRVRQKTMSAAPEEVAAAITQAHAENAANAAPKVDVPMDEPLAGASEGYQGQGGADPLGAYLEELDGGDSNGGLPHQSPADPFDPLGLGSDSDPSFGAPEETPPAQARGGFFAPPPVSEPYNAESADPYGDSPAPLGDSMSRTGRNGAEDPFEAPSAPAPARAPMMSSGRPPREERPRFDAPAPKSAPQMRDANKQKESTAVKGRNDGQGREQGNRSSVGDRDRGGREDRHADHSPTSNGTPASGAHAPTANRTSQPRVEGVPVGKLGGWLVSYKRGEGDGIELREGKFFVTSSSIKGSDLVLDDATISAPHALMSVSVESGIKVQDLMSDRGVFVKRQGSEEFDREEGVTVLNHGDWIRLGDLEFLVVVVPFQK